MTHPFCYYPSLAPQQSRYPGMYLVAFDYDVNIAPNNPITHPQKTNHPEINPRRNEVNEGGGFRGWPESANDAPPRGHRSLYTHGPRKIAYPGMPIDIIHHWLGTGRHLEVQDGDYLMPWGDPWRKIPKRFRWNLAIYTELQKKKSCPSLTADALIICKF